MNHTIIKFFTITCTFFLTISYSCKGKTQQTVKKPAKNNTSTYKNVENYPNGNLKIKGDIVNGIKQGKWESFYENGNKWSECTYVFGKRNGIYKTFYPNGNLKMHGVYQEDKKVDVWFFYLENGKTYSEDGDTDNYVLGSNKVNISGKIGGSYSLKRQPPGVLIDNNKIKPFFK